MLHLFHFLYFMSSPNPQSNQSGFISLLPPLSFPSCIIHGISHPISAVCVLPFLTAAPCGAVCHFADFYIKIHILLVVMFFRMSFNCSLFQSMGELERF